MVLNSSELLTGRGSPTIEESFAFCNNKCVVMSFYNFPTYQGLGLIVNNVFKQVDVAYCPPADPSPLIDSTYFKKLVNNPPETLTERYYECRTPLSDAVLDSIGIANGNTAVYVPIMVSILLPLVYYFFKLIGYHPPIKEYSKEEKEDMLGALAVHLMRIRDGKTRSFKKDDTILKLFQELKKADKVPPGYPDSDDDDDSDSDKESKFSLKPTSLIMIKIIKIIIIITLHYTILYYIISIYLPITFITCIYILL